MNEKARRRRVGAADPVEALAALSRQAAQGDVRLPGAHGAPPAGWGEIVRLVPLSGGSVNRVYRAALSTGVCVVFKWHENPPEGFFQAERRGLQELKAAKVLRVPDVYAVGPNGIVMEWLGAEEETSEPDVGAALGDGLARQHHVTADAYGLDDDNFVGLLPQRNGRSTGWIPFFRDRRLRPQLELAETRGRMNSARRRLADRLLDRLPEWIDETDVAPSLLHGDLWGGNWIATPGGPALLDPAVYYGDREMDVAMADLFGGFPRSFFDAYCAAYPLAPGHKARRPIYQLYYLLIHLNMFGEAYGPQVDRVFRRYGR